jgi:hypothetical protein
MKKVISWFLGEIFQIGESGNVDDVKKFFEKNNLANLDASLGEFTGNEQGIRSSIIYSTHT